jgi:uncharacterized protein YaiL (DUF2058 family)
MIELTPEQHEILNQNGSGTVRAVDVVTNAEYVLVPANVYDRLKSLLPDVQPDTMALMNEVMAEDDANDPYLDSYQRHA